MVGGKVIDAGLSVHEGVLCQRDQAILFIAVWIGWTMAMTPPPALIEEDVEVKTEE